MSNVNFCFRIETKEICNIIKEMLDKDQKNRITSSDVVNRLINILKVRQKKKKKKKKLNENVLFQF